MNMCINLQAKQLLNISREYIVGLSMEMERKELPKVNNIVCLCVRL